MKRLLTLFVISAALTNGAIIYTWQFDISQSGNDANGCAFVFGSSGTDYSQQSSAHVTINNSSITATLSTASPGVITFTGGYVPSAADVGNVVQLASATGGTLTAGFYSIASETSTTWTLDRAACATSTCTITAGNMGGSCLTLGNTLPLLTGGGGPRVWLRYSATPYTVSSTITIPNGGNGEEGLSILGYNSTHGDQPTGANRPVIEPAASDIWLFNSGRSGQIGNIIFNGNSEAVSAVYYTSVPPGSGGIGGMQNVLIENFEGPGVTEYNYSEYATGIDFDRAEFTNDCLASSTAMMGTSYVYTSGELSSAGSSAVLTYVSGAHSPTSTDVGSIFVLPFNQTDILDGYYFVVSVVAGTSWTLDRTFGNGTATSAFTGILVGPADVFGYLAYSVAANTNVVTNSWFHDNPCTGIRFGNTADNPLSSEVDHTVFSNLAGSTTDAMLVQGQSGAEGLSTNNVFYNIGRDCIRTYSTSSEQTVYFAQVMLNNIFDGCGEYGINFVNGFAPSSYSPLLPMPLLHPNVYYNSGTANANNLGTGTSYGDIFPSASPLNNPGSDDFSLALPGVIVGQCLPGPVAGTAMVAGESSCGMAEPRRTFGGIQ